MVNLLQLGIPLPSILVIIQEYFLSKLMGKFMILLTVCTLEPLSTYPNCITTPLLKSYRNPTSLMGSFIR